MVSDFICMFCVWGVFAQLVAAGRGVNEVMHVTCNFSYSGIHVHYEITGVCPLLTCNMFSFTYNFDVFFEFYLYPDNFAKREMLSHEVFCRMKKQRGCPWKGPLGKLEVK